MSTIFLPLVIASALFVNSITFSDETFELNYRSQGSEWVKAYIFEGPIFEDEVCKKVSEGAQPILSVTGDTLVGTFQGTGDEAIAILTSLEGCEGGADGDYEEFYTPQDYTEALK